MKQVLCGLHWCLLRLALTARSAGSLHATLQHGVAGSLWCSPRGYFMWPGALLLLVMPIMMLAVPQ